MTVKAVIATAGDRAEMLGWVTVAWAALLGEDNVIVETGTPGGANFNRGFARLADDDIGIVAADDALPLFDKDTVAHVVNLLDSKRMPAPRFLTRDGSPLKAGVDDVPEDTPVYWTRFPILTGCMFHEIGEFLNTSWYLDLDYTERLKYLGWVIVSCPAFVFMHLDGDRSWLTPEVQASEEKFYRDAQAARV